MSDNFKNRFDGVMPQSEEEYLTQARAEANAGKVVYRALSAFEQVELQEQNAILTQQVKELAAALCKAQEQIQGLDDTLECALCLINYYQKKDKQ